MSTQQEQEERGLVLRVPRILELRDLITIVSVAVSLTLAWGVFSTRITVLEREVVSLQQSVQSVASSVETLQAQHTRIAAHQQDDELLIDQLYQLMGKPVPTRRAPGR